MYLFNTNLKLGKSIYSFNLPIDTCKPFRTKLCEAHCYAKHGGFTFPNFLKRVELNYQASLLSNFIQIIHLEIQRKKRRVKYIRLHSCGDFYSQEYYAKWNKIASLNPEIRFLAYTRNYSIDFSDRVSNFIIYYSIDNTTEKVNPSLFLHVNLIPFEESKQSKEYKHMQKYQNFFICYSKCDQCRACFFGLNHIAFLQRWRTSSTTSSLNGIPIPKLERFRRIFTLKTKFQ